MKRLFVFCMVLVSALYSQLSLAAPFVYGPTAEGQVVFTGGNSLEQNLESLVANFDGDRNAWQLVGNPSDPALNSTSYYFSLIGFSDYTDDYGLSIYDNKTGSSVASSSGNKNTIDAHLLSDLSIHFSGMAGSVTVSLIDYLQTGFVLTDGSWQFDDYFFEQGTLFLGGSYRDGESDNEIDFIIAATPFTAATPVPAAAWLLGTGLAGLYAMHRRKKV